VAERTVRSEGELSLTNRAWPFTVVVLGLWFALLCFGLPWALEIHFGQSPFLLWANFPSRVLLLVGLAWTVCAPFLSWIFNYVCAPPRIIRGEDGVERTPPRRYAPSSSRRSAVIRFAAMRGAGWNLLGPSVVGSRSAPNGAMLLLSHRNSKAVRERWIRWKEQQDASLADRPSPAT
jgi:hypothetical protein